MTVVGLPARAPQRAPRAFVVAGGLLVGALVMAFVASNAAASLAQRSLRARWERALASRPAQARAGEPVAQLSVPSIGLDVVVTEGPSSARRAPVHLARTALPGRSGLSAIEAGRFGFGSFFGSIDRLASGDEIDVRIPGGIVRYRVIDARVLDRAAIDLSTNGDAALLLLIAPASRLGGSDRIVVRARAEGS